MCLSLRYISDNQSTLPFLRERDFPAVVFKVFVNVYMHVCVQVCHTNAGSCRGQKRARSPPELELELLVNRVGAGN